MSTFIAYWLGVCTLLVPIALMVRLGHGADMLHLLRKVFSTVNKVNPDGTTDLMTPGQRAEWDKHQASMKAAGRIYFK